MTRSPARLPSNPSRLLTWPIVLLAFSMVIAAPAIAGGEHEDSGELEHKVATAGKVGISLLLAELYNDHRLVYSLVVTLTMAILGMVVAQVTELVLRLLRARRPGGIH